MDSSMAYVGGKSRLAKKIISYFPDHTCYCEPFCGAAWVFFRKEPSKVEVLNDKDSELITFYRVIQNHFEEFLNKFKFYVTSRELFEIEQKKDVSTLTDIQRAIKYFYLIRTCYGGKIIGQDFGYGTERPGSLNLLTLEETLLKVHWRLSRVTIENLDYWVCFEKYDRPHTLFYIDPPYYGTKSYKTNFEPEDYFKLSKILSKIKGKFIVSLNDVKDIRKAFKGFKIISLDTKYSLSKPADDSRSKTRKELLIKNF